jgi:ATP-dependent Clp protease ATP-binding subunit ClpA
MYPFQRFTESARQVLTTAQQEASARRVQYIGTEHLALALCRDEDGIAGRVLADLGVTHATIEAQVGGLLDRTTDPGTGRIFPTSRVKRVVELAFQEATIAGAELVGTEHLLLAVLVEAEGVAARALDELGATLPKVRRAVRAALDDRAAQQGSAPTHTIGTSSQLIMVLMRAAQLAREEGVPDIRPDHLLRAMAASEVPDVRGVLRKLGLAPDAVTTELTVPDEIRQLGLAARTARTERAAALDAGGAGAGQAIEEVERLSRTHAEALSRWLGEGATQ